MPKTARKARRAQSLRDLLPATPPIDGASAPSSDAETTGSAFATASEAADAAPQTGAPNVFAQLLEAFPRHMLSGGFFQVVRITMSNSGSLQSSVGYFPANTQDMVTRVQRAALKHGPGTYMVFPCDVNRRRTSNAVIASIEFSKDDIEELAKSLPPDAPTTTAPPTGTIPTSDSPVAQAVADLNRQIRDVIGLREASRAAAALNSEPAQQAPFDPRVGALNEKLDDAKDELDEAKKEMEAIKSKAGEASSFKDVIGPMLAQQSAQAAQSQQMMAQQSAQSQQMILGIVTALAPVLAAVLQKPKDNGQTDIFKSIIDSNRTQAEMMMRSAENQNKMMSESIRGLMESMKSAQENTMARMEAQDERFQQSIGAILEDKSSRDKMSSETIVGLIGQGMQIAQNAAVGEAVHPAIPIIKEIGSALGPVLQQVLISRQEQINKAAAVGQQNAQAGEQLQALIAREAADSVTKILSEQKQPPLPGMVAPAPQLQAGPPTSAKFSAAVNPQPQPQAPVMPPGIHIVPKPDIDLIMDTICQESATLPQPAMWQELAFDTLPDALVQPIYEAETIEAVLNVLRPHTSPAKFEALVIRLGAGGVPVQQWFGAGLMGLKAQFEADQEQAPEEGDGEGEDGGEEFPVAPVAPNASSDPGPGVTTAPRPVAPPVVAKPATAKPAPGAKK